MPGPKAILKTLAARLLRPGLAQVEHRLAQLEKAAAMREQAIWRGGLTGGPLPQAGAEDSVAIKYRQELTFWRNLVREKNYYTTFQDEFGRSFSHWQRERLLKLADFLDLDDEAELDRWCLERSAIEIGSGPYPALAAAKWKRAVAVDPLADGFVSEGLVVPECSHVVFLAATGEAVPLPGGSADLIVIENCLDHVSDQQRVLEEIRRLLIPGGYLWLLVDLSCHTDEMHPHPMDDSKMRHLLGAAGLEIVREKITDHASHPEAYGEYRVLARKIEVNVEQEAEPASAF